MRKADFVVLREIFSFILGVIIMTGVISIFNDSINKQINKFNVNEQAKAVLNHFNSLIEQVNILARNSENTELSISYEMPEKISDHTYRIYFEENQACIITRGEMIITQCSNLTTNSTLVGTYSSGTELLIQATTSEEGTVILTENKYDYMTICTEASCNDNNPCTSNQCIGITCYTSPLNGQRSECMMQTGCAGTGKVFCTCNNGTCTDTCGNNICESYLGENMNNCLIDCSPKRLALFLGGINLVNYQMIKVSDEELAYGNQSIIYVPSGNKERDCGIMYEDKFFIIFSESDGMDYLDLKYTYYDGNSFKPVNNIFSQKIYDEIHVYCSPATRSNIINLMYFNCTESPRHCPLYYINWSETQSFSTPMLMTNNTIETGTDNGVYFSNNGNYGVVFWSAPSSNGINITRYVNGEWLSEEEIITPGADSIDYVRGAVNNKGEIMLAYYHAASLMSYYIFINDTINIGELAPGDYKPKGEGLRALSDDSFLISFDPMGGQIYYKIFRNNALTELIELTGANEGFINLNSFGEIIAFNLNYVTGAKITYVNLTSDQTFLGNITFCGMFGCENYEKCSTDCLTEVYCDDGVDNNEDGLIDNC